MTDKQINITDLDGAELKATKGVDTQILQSADKYHVDLAALDKLQEPAAPIASSHKTAENFWQGLDVNLSDIINLIVASSERPTFMIRDDKLVYLNAAAMRLLDIGVDKDVIGGNFFNLVAKEDWNLLAENIGEMLTNAKSLRIKLKSLSGKVFPMGFQAIYLSEIEHFSFILLGEHIARPAKPAFNNLYDDVTGLPNFFLFEDRVQVAIALENAKENAREVDMIAVVAINIENIEAFRKMRIEELAIKKTANNLVLNLPKNATVAVGLKYNFWVMLPGIKNKAELNQKIRLLAEVLDGGVSDNFTRHELIFSMGVSSFPQPAHSAKKLIEQSIAALKKAQCNPKSPVEFFIGENI